MDLILVVAFLTAVFVVGLAVLLAAQESYESPTEKAIREFRDNSASARRTINDLSDQFLRDVDNQTRR